jgi:hypothetical protein
MWGCPRMNSDPQLIVQDVGQGLILIFKNHGNKE